MQWLIVIEGVLILVACLCGVVCRFIGMLLFVLLTNGTIFNEDKKSVYLANERSLRIDSFGSFCAFICYYFLFNWPIIVRKFVYSMISVNCSVPLIYINIHKHWILLSFAIEKWWNRAWNNTHICMYIEKREKKMKRTLKFRTKIEMDSILLHTQDSHQAVGLSPFRLWMPKLIETHSLIYFHRFLF